MVIITPVLTPKFAPICLIYIIYKTFSVITKQLPQGLNFAPKMFHVKHQKDKSYILYKQKSTQTQYHSPK